MRYFYLFALLLAVSLSPVSAHGDGPPPPEEGGGAPPAPQEGGGGPPAPQEGGAQAAPQEGGFPPAPQEGGAPPQAEQAGGGIPPLSANRRPADGRRKPKIFKNGEEVHIAGGRNCYLRPQCNGEKAKSRYKGKLSGRRILCQKGKPNPTQKQFVWKAHTCSSPEGKKHHFVRFENAKHKNRYLCLTRKTHKPPKRRYGVHIAILGHKKNGGCAWKVKEAMVYNRGLKKMEQRLVFINRKHKHYTMRVRRRCKFSPPGPRRMFAAQNYLNEARLDTRGTFRVEPLAPAGDGYTV